MLEAIRDYLVEQGRLPAGRGSGDAFIQIPGSRVSTFVFFGDGGRPACVVKLARSRAGEAYLGMEWAALRRLASRPEEWIRASVPEPVALIERGGRSVLIQSGLPGRPISALRRRHPGGAGRFAAIERAVDWIARLHAAAAMRGNLTEQEVQEMFLDPIERFVSAYSLTPAGRGSAESLHGFFSGMVGKPFCRTLTHGDYSAANVLFDGKQIYAVDWARSEPAGAPIIDLVQFLESATKLDGAADRLDWVVELRGGRAESPLAVRRHVESYCRTLEIGLEWVGPLVAIKPVHRAVGYPHRIDAIGAERHRDTFERLARHLQSEAV